MYFHDLQLTIVPELVESLGKSECSDVKVMIDNEESLFIVLSFQKKMFLKYIGIWYNRRTNTFCNYNYEELDGKYLLSSGSLLHRIFLSELMEDGSIEAFCEAVKQCEEESRQKAIGDGTFRGSNTKLRQDADNEPSQFGHYSSWIEEDGLMNKE